MDLQFKKIEVTSISQLQDPDLIWAKVEILFHDRAADAFPLITVRVPIPFDSRRTIKETQEEAVTRAKQVITAFPGNL